MEYYSAIKENSFESVLMRWMKLEPIIQSEVSQKDKDQITFKITITPPPGMSDMMKGMGSQYGGSIRLILGEHRKQVSAGDKQAFHTKKREQAGRDEGKLKLLIMK